MRHERTWAIYEIIEGTDCNGSLSKQATRQSGKVSYNDSKRMVKGGFFDKKISFLLSGRILPN
jgi:hypothetical protein